MKLTPLEITLLKYISKRHGPTRIADIGSHLLGSVDRAAREQALQELIEKNLIEKVDNLVKLTEPEGTDYISFYDLYEHEEVHNGHLQFAILKFLHEVGGEIGLEYLPAIFKSNAPVNSNGSEDMNLIYYLEFNAGMKQFIQKKGNHQYQLSKEGEVKYQAELAKRQPVKPMVNQTAMKQVNKENPTVFIIHGHDNSMKQAVQLFLTRAGLNEVVLHEKPDLGRTVIDKLVEEGATADYVIALLSPDDLQHDGSVRARQNVILEIGYFMGKLGRQYVRLLKSGGTDIPSDLSGILYEDYDTNGNWRMKLAKEMKAAGIAVNLEKVLEKY